MTQFERLLLQMLYRLAQVIYNCRPGSGQHGAEDSDRAKAHLDLMAEMSESV